jgi:hypothetical protein
MVITFKWSSQKENEGYAILDVFPIKNPFLPGAKYL